jgi:protein TonB
VSRRAAVVAMLCCVLSLAAPMAAARASGLEPGGMPRIVDCRPERLRTLLLAADSCVLGKACGRIDTPWLYRGTRGYASRMRVRGTRVAGTPETRTLVGELLRDARIDSAFKVPPIEVSCENNDAIPVYLATFTHGDSIVRAVLRFDTGQVLLFNREVPLGSVAMGANADSLWARLSVTLDWDPLLAGPRPEVRRPAPPDKLPLGTVVTIEELPEALGKIPPVYPDAARMNGTQGTVWVQALVGTGGSIQDAVVISGPDELLDASLEAVWQWTFNPARVNGKPVAVWVAIPVKYSLH